MSLLAHTSVERTYFPVTPPPHFGSHGNHSTLVHTRCCRGDDVQTSTTANVIWRAEKEQSPYFHLSLKPMADFTGLRSCTWTEFPALPAQNASSVTRSNTASSCDLTLLTCLLIGSYRFCIIPLLAVFNGNDKKLWRSKWILQLIHMLQQILL